MFYTYILTNVQGVKLELELKEEKLSALTRELDELTFGGKTEEEVAQLKKAKHEMEKKLKEQVCSNEKYKNFNIRKI